MTVRDGLLAILDQGPCYGYQLRAEFDRRTGATTPLNVGQVYNTLERLRRDGLVTAGGTDEHGHVYWQITASGEAAVRAWLDKPIAPAGARDELAVKVSLAATLPGVDIHRMLRMQRIATEVRLTTLQAERTDTRAVARMIVLDALELTAEAELRWIDRVAERLSGLSPSALALELSAEKPRRGRPARAGASVA